MASTTWGISTLTVSWCNWVRCKLIKLLNISSQAVCSLSLLLFLEEHERMRARKIDVWCRRKHGSNKRMAFALLNFIEDILVSMRYIWSHVHDIFYRSLIPFEDIIAVWPRYAQLHQVCHTLFSPKYRVTLKSFLQIQGVCTHCDRPQASSKTKILELSLHNMFRIQRKNMARIGLCNFVWVRSKGIIQPRSHLNIEKAPHINQSIRLNRWHQGDSNLKCCSYTNQLALIDDIKVNLNQSVGLTDDIKVNLT